MKGILEGLCSNAYTFISAEPREARGREKRRGRRGKDHPNDDASLGTPVAPHPRKEASAKRGGKFMTPRTNEGL